MSGTVMLRRHRALVLADTLPGTVVRDVLLVVGTAGLVGALAQISVHLSFTPVPITGQTLGVLLGGTALGWKRGTAALGLYALAGLVGVPWFAGHDSGYAGASFGYILGFVLCAALCGFLAERGADRSIAAKAIALGLTPFLAGDAIKAAIAAVLLPGAWKLAGRN
jgi:biotin transport system substrate-specific component